MHIEVLLFQESVALTARFSKLTVYNWINVERGGGRTQ